jgi:hypothetical protein
MARFAAIQDALGRPIPGKFRHPGPYKVTFFPKHHDTCRLASRIAQKAISYHQEKGLQEDL